MARIDGISDADANWVTRQVYKAANRQLGAVPDPLRIYAHCPPVMFAAGAFEGIWGRASSVDPIPASTRCSTPTRPGAPANP